MMRWCYAKRDEHSSVLQSTSLLSRGKCTYLPLSAVTSSYFPSRRQDDVARGAEQAVVAVARMSRGRGSLFLSDAMVHFFFFNISEMFAHGVSPWDVRVCGWMCVGECMWVCRVPFSRRSISQSGRFSSHAYQAESKEIVFRKVLNKESGWTGEREDERTMLMLVSK